jgi:2-C-methyl-D-erythritol 4-phosphate cytidylyltransferase
MQTLAVILPAAGSSTRFGRNKLIEPLNGVPVFARALQAFLDHPQAALVIVATNDPAILRLVERIKSDRVRTCPGGATRAHSVQTALRATPASIEWIAVHDAARPLVSKDLIDQTLAAAIQHGAAVPALPVSLTIKQATGPLPAKVQRTVPRHELWAMQTPQIAHRTDLLHGFEQCPIPLDQITDDVQLLELQGKEVWLVPGSERNLKITTETDLRLAEMFLQQAGER